MIRNFTQERRTLDTRPMPYRSCFMLDEHYDFLVIPSAINQGPGLPTLRELEGCCDQKSHTTAGRMIMVG